MTQQIINLGSGPDTQTGDSLYTAFTKVNDNFTELYSVFDGNGISHINANVIISNNIVVSSNIRTGNIAAYGNIETVGYIVTAGAFYPNGLPIGSLGSIDSNIVPLVTNLYSIGSSSLQFSQAYFSTNISLAGANVTVRDGLLYVNGQIASGNYGNSNVAAYLPVYGGNISATITTANQLAITQVGTLSNLTANVARIYGNLVVEGNLSVDGNVTFFNVDNLLVEDPIITLNTGANGAPLTSDNGFDSGIKSYYFDTQNREAFFGRKDSTGYFEYYSNVVSDIGNIVSGTYGTIKTGNLILTEQANITGNVSANYFLGNGRFLDGIDTTLISNGNSNVQVFQNGNIAISSGGVANVAQFTTIGGNIAGDFYITGTIKALNYIGNVQGNLSAPGANTQVIFNDNSTAGATAGFTFDKFTNSVVISGDLTAIGQAYLSNLTILGNTIYVQNTNDDIVLQPDSIANVYIGQIGQNNQLVVSGNINTPANIVVAGSIVIDSNGNVVTARLQDSGVIAGTYGNASAVPVITVDDKGRITVASTTAVAGVNNVTYDPVLSNLTIFTSAGTNYSVDLNVGTADAPNFSGLAIAGNLTANGISVNNSVTIGSTLGVLGNVAANAATFTGNITTANLFVENFVGGNLIPSANISYNLGSEDYRWKDLYLSGNSIYLGDVVISSDIGDLNISGALTAESIFSNTIGNSISEISGNTLTIVSNSAIGSITVSNSAVIGLTLQVQGGIQNTVIGNAQPTQAFFTSESVSGNSTVNGLTVNTSVTIGEQLSAPGGIQNTPIGNEITSSGAFTAVTAALIGNIGTNHLGNSFTALTSFNGNLQGALGLAGGNSAIISELSVSGNAVSQAIFSNSTLAVASAITSGSLYTGLINANNSIVVNSLNVNTAGVFGETINANGTITGANLNTDGSITAAGNINANGIIYSRSRIVADGGLQNTPIGNLTPRSAYFTTVDASGNITASALTTNGSITAGTTLQVQGGIQDTPIGNVTPSSAQFTTVNTSGNITASALTTNGSITAGTTLHVQGGIQNTPIGNVTPNSAQFTTVNTSGNITAFELTVNSSATIGSTLEVVGNINGSGLSLTGSATVGNSLAVAGNVTVTNGNIFAQRFNSLSTELTPPVQGSDRGYRLTIYDFNQNSVNYGIGAEGGHVWTAVDSYAETDGFKWYGNVNPVARLSAIGNFYLDGNITASSAGFGNTVRATGNITGGNITSNGSITAQSSLSAAGGIQNTAIGNVIPSTAQFTSVNSSGNVTGAALTANSSITAGTTFSAAGGVQNTPIGNVAPSTAQFTTVNASSNVTVAALTTNGSMTVGDSLSASGGIQNTPIGNTTPSSAKFTSANVIGNTTTTSLTVNADATIGTTLDVTGNTFVGNLRTQGTVLITNTINSTGANTGALIVQGGASFEKDIHVLGNVYTTNIIAVNANTLSVQDPLLYLTANTPYPYDYDIGFFSQFSLTSNLANYQHTGLVRDVDDGVWKLFSNVYSEPTITVDFTNATYDNLLTGTHTVLGQIIGNSTLSVNETATVGNLISNGYVSAQQITLVNANISGNLVTNGLTVNTSTVIGTTLQVLSGIQNTVIGNATPNSAYFTSIDSSGNATINAITINNSATIGTNLGVAGNILVGNLSSIGSITALGGIQATPIGNVTPSTAQFTTVTASGNITTAALTANGSITAGTTLNAVGGIQNTPIGNVTPSTAQFTTVSLSGNITAAALTANGSITAGTTLQAQGGIQNTPIGNITPSTAQFTTVNASGNVTAAALTANGSITTGATLQAQGGIQNTPIGNVTPNSAQFTTVNASGNVTAAALTANGSITTGATLQAQGGIQNTVIGNVVPSTAQFTTATASGNITAAELTANGSITSGTTISAAGGIQNTPIGNVTPSSAQFTNLNTSGNITGAALTANGSITSGTTLQAQGGIQNTPIGNVTPNSAQFTTVNTSGNITTAALTVNGSSTIGSTLSVAGNLSSENLITPSVFAANIISPVINLNSQSVITASGNLNPVAGNTYSLGNSTNYWSTLFANNLLISNNLTLGGNLSNGGNINGNGLTIVGSGTLTSTLSVSGGIQNTVIGNVTPAEAYFTTTNTSGNATVNGLTVNNSATIGSTLSVTGNITAPYLIGNIIGNISGNIAAPGSNRQVLFNDNNLVSGDSGLTYNKDTNELSVTGNLDINWISAAGGAEFKLPVVVDAGLQNTAIGNVTPSFAIFTTESVSGNSTVNALTVNTSVTVGSSLSAAGGIQATPIGNVSPSSAQFTTLNVNTSATANSLTVNSTVTIGSLLTAQGGIQTTTVNSNSNVTVNGLTVNNSGTFGTSLSALGGLQNTPIGNIAPSTAQFTTVSASGNIIGAALTANGSITSGTTLSAAGGIQNTPIGNVTPSTAIFTSESVSGNSTVNGLTVNTSATVGSTLGVTGNLIAGNISTAGILRVTSTTPSISNVTGAVQISGGLGVSGNVYVAQRVGFVAANSVSAVYQIYNPVTNSLDTVFG
jgi:hypothetical protein